MTPSLRRPGQCLPASLSGGLLAVGATLVLSTSVFAQSSISGSGGSGAAPAPATTGENAGASSKRLLEDFLHYVRIARPDLAASNARSLFESGVSDAELAILVDDNDLGERVEGTLRVGRGMDGVADLVAEFETRLEKGRRDLGRDSARVKEAVQMLIGTRRQQMLAQARLEQAGEYAVPELLQQMIETRNAELEQAAREMLVRIRRQAVTPLSEALTNLDPNDQTQVCQILGAIAWPHAAPYLLALSNDTSRSPDVREAAAQAFAAVGASGNDLSEQWTQLSRRYFDEAQSLIAFPAEPTNNLWLWDNFVGLVPQPVPTAIFSEIMAMKTAREALRTSPENAVALSLFVASDLKRENELPAGETDPVFGANVFSPQFFATAAGADTALRVLTLGLSSYNTPLVRDAILALRQTAGAGNLQLTTSQGAPISEALRYPDRRVQYEAALAIANALPKETFPGDFGVVPTLASAVRTGNAIFAAVIAGDNEDRQVLASRLQANGFTVLNSGSTLGEIDPDIAAAPGIDLLVVRGSGAFVREQLAAIRGNNRTIAAPVLLVTTAIDKITLANDIEGDRRTLAWQAGLSDETFSAAVDAVMLQTSGGRITDSEAQQYAIEALDALATLAVSSNTVLKVDDAQSALLDALDSRTGGVRQLVADVLSLINSEPAQRRLFDAALSAKESEQIELLDRVAASARRFGNRAEPRHIEGLLALVEGATGPTADAAARAHGALNLPAANAVKLIVK